MRGGDLASLVLAAILESLGYRQWSAWLSCIATFRIGAAPGWRTLSRHAFGWSMVVLLLAGS
jgi:hypothetical protein